MMAKVVVSAVVDDESGRIGKFQANSKRVPIGWANYAKMSKNCSSDQDEGDAALYLPPAPSLNKPDGPWPLSHH
jgi:hypothetical protein